MDAPARVEQADALRPVELVRRETQQVDRLRREVDGEVPRRLHGVRVEENALRAAERADLVRRLDGADLVVGVHDRDKAGVGAECGGDVRGGDDAVLMDGQERHVEAPRAQTVQRVQDGVVLEGGGDDVAAALCRTERGSGEERLIIAFTAAGGEHKLVRRTPEQARHCLARADEDAACSLPCGVQAGGIAVLLPQTGEHRGERRLTQARGGGIIGIDKHGDLLYNGYEMYGRN